MLEDGADLVDGAGGAHVGVERESCWGARSMNLESRARRVFPGCLSVWLPACFKAYILLEVGRA